MVAANERYKFYREQLEGNPDLLNRFRLPWNPEYVKHEPTPKQRLALMLPHREVFYGGAAGGGKSDWLLMSALQYVQFPGYHAILFRRHRTDAYLPGAIGHRAAEWLSDSNALRRGDCWTFPSGASLTIAFLSDPQDKFRYQGSNFHFIGFDELTQFFEVDFQYLFSRCRRQRCEKHRSKPNDYCRTCREFAASSRIPLRIRAAANPGGLGHLWVKRRYGITPAVLSRGKNGEKVFRKNVFGQTLFMGSNPERPFIPAFLTDNPYLDVDEYLKNLEELDPVTRNQLKGGDWDVAADGRFKQEWSRYYSVAGNRVTLFRNGQRKAYRIDECRRFTIIDPATSAAEGPGDKTNLRQEMPSWTVIGTFLLTPDGHLLVWDWWRMQEEVDVVIKAIKQTYTRHEPIFIGLELSPISTHLYQALSRIGMPLQPLRTGGKDKLARATDIITRMEQGRVWFPDWSPPWLEALHQELFTWTAHPYEEDDQIDVMAYAGMWVSRNSATVADERVWSSNPLALDDMTPGSC